eukprot:TRINITY_DN6745_c0_g1_i7.p1 TRINITY_DN6745_c0_g1~~TRINITY_DN6745_c0_g1_i7.p1  ORF type:complete len:273 (+),score=106.90 TRINITY_DN6745_c0_g1_i7:285-1103(+)
MYELKEFYECMVEKKVLAVSIVRSIVECLVQDLQATVQTDPNCLFALQLAKHFSKFPVESCTLLLSLKKYKKCLGGSSVDDLKDVLAKYDTSGISAMSPKELLCTLRTAVRGAMLTQAIHDHTNTAVKNHKLLALQLKAKSTLERDIKSFDDTKFNAARNKNIPFAKEKKQKLKEKQAELQRVSEEIEKLNVTRSEMLGTDYERREYWTFTGDSRRIYVRTLGSEGKEEWGVYSKLEQVKELLSCLCDQGVNEHRLKERIIQVVQHMKFDQV